MPEKGSNPDWDFKDRDLPILQLLADDPQMSSRRLTERLEEEHAIDVSNVTVSETIRKMREENVFTEAIIPNEEYLFFGLFEYQFNPEGFEEGWRDAMEDIRNDRHTFLFFLSDGEYQWKSVMMFRDREQESKWIHNFYKKHGNVINNLRNSVVTNVLKFRADPEIFSLLDE
ncbi:winged helix-turn-helix domain-containing protein [Halorubellus salinus]|uniref:winged helix-turn-helix domain-containing protein n=1 Tax=Halorubellus salinus TaxID=755309 RepID=UPI001D072A23|nr:winged helix-turn-helix domain-containing protein [Halorubellus salinus]